MADGRLGQMQRTGGTGQAAFPLNGIEHVQQVQIKAIEGHGWSPFTIRFE